MLHNFSIRDFLSWFWRWTGFGDKKLWDFLTPLIAIATVASAFITISNQQKSETNRYQEEALTKYIDQIREFLIKDNLRQDPDQKKINIPNENIVKKDQNEGQKIIANARTISTLQQLDKNRKMILLKFLIQTKLVNTDPNKNPNLVGGQFDFSKETHNPPTISLSNTNLEQVNLSGVNLSGANLSGANLSGANLSGADLSGADLSGANLSGANLSKANLVGASLIYAVLNNAELQQTALNRSRLREAKLIQANLTGADFSEANFMGTNLRNVKGLIFEQVKLAQNWQDALYDNNLIPKYLQAKIQPEKHKICGRYTDTYIIGSPDNPTGIRCVFPIISNNVIEKIIWYGEGIENGKEYRQVGNVLLKTPNSFEGNAFSIGNNIGNQRQNKQGVYFPNKKIDIKDNQGSLIEQWMFVSPKQSIKYKAIKPPQKSCGSGEEVREYKVYPILTRGEGNPNSDWGIRCVLNNEKDEITWFGTGQWENRPYYHLGITFANGDGESVDICNLLDNSFCYKVDRGFLKLKKQNVGFDVTGDWKENWRR